jgi:primosomal protein N' (replication factor Y)
MQPIDKARKLRQAQTDAEKRLWRHLRNRAMDGCKFRRQHPVGPYICDFVCLERRLVIEVDGGQHTAMRDADRRRSAFLEAGGFAVMRFWNHEVLSQTEAVLQRIHAAVEKPPSPCPSPHRGEGTPDAPPREIAAMRATGHTTDSAHDTADAGSASSAKERKAAGGRPAEKGDNPKHPARRGRQT